MISGDWNTYFKKIKDDFKDSTELTFRTPLENLLNEIKPDKKVNIIHEQKREKGFGAPDFRIEKSGAIIGYLETKPLNEDLDKVLKSEQVKKYLSVNPNLILTNYREFILILDQNIIERANLFFLTDLNQKRSQLKEEHIVSIEQLIKKFFLSALPLNIWKADKLAIHMADRAKILKEYINEILESESTDRFSMKVLGLYEVFRKTLIEDLTKEEFADAYSQTVLYGFFLSYLQSGKRITLDDASNFIPVSFKVIKEFFNVINDYDMPSHIKWIYTEIVNLINNVDLEGIYKSISFKRDKQIQQKYTAPH